MLSSRRNKTPVETPKSPSARSPSGALGRKESNEASIREAEILRDQVTELDLAKKKAESELRALRDDILYKTDATRAAEAVAHAAFAKSQSLATQLQRQAEKYAIEMKAIKERLKPVGEGRVNQISEVSNSPDRQLSSKKSTRTNTMNSDEKLKIIAAQLAQEHQLRLAAEQRAKRLDELYTTSMKEILQARTNQDILNKSMQRDISRASEADNTMKATTAMANQIERIGSLLAASGELSDAELLYKESARIKSALFGAPHSQHATGFRQLASHCQKQNNLPAALSYLEQSCSEFSSSLRSGEQVLDARLTNKHHSTSTSIDESPLSSTSAAASAHTDKHASQNTCRRRILPSLSPSNSSPTDMRRREGSRLPYN